MAYILIIKGFVYNSSGAYYLRGKNIDDLTYENDKEDNVPMAKFYFYENGAKAIYISLKI